MDRVLVVTVRLHEGRYHGWPEWPPSPARLFQALVAGAARGDAMPPAHRACLAVLERLGAPVIAAPAMRRGRPYQNYMPNNDLDAALPTRLKAGGTLAEAVASIRAPKETRALIFDEAVPFLYLFGLTDDAPDETEFNGLAEGLYQFGRGIDLAYASAMVLAGDQADDLLAAYPGAVHRPGEAGGTALAVPVAGTLASLEARYRGFRMRLQRKAGGIVFAQPPKPLTRQVAYDAPPARLLFDIDGPAIDPAETVALTMAIRDGLAARLKQTPGAAAGLIDRQVIGQGATEADKAGRLRITPLPSIGHQHADRGIRRVVVEVPAGSGLRRDQLDWALGGLELAAFSGALLTPADETDMLRHYGAGTPVRLWRSVTPLALTARAPAGIVVDNEGRPRKPAALRVTEEAAARAAVAQAVRQAGIPAHAEAIRVQREPFAAKDRRAESFAAGPRFAAARLWHVELVLDRAVEGPLVLGDGRYLGLGLMAPDRDAEPGADGLMAFHILDGLTPGADPETVALAMRRALMARVRDHLRLRPDDGLPLFFSGHTGDGSKAADGRHRHVAIACDGARILVVAPHVLTRSDWSYRDRRDWQTLREAMAGMADLRAGTAGRLTLAPATVGAADPLRAASTRWHSVTTYRPARHAKRLAPAKALAADIAEALREMGLPEAEVQVTGLHEGPRGGLAGHAEVTFAVAVDGPLLIGRTRHKGGGLFAAMPAP